MEFAWYIGKRFLTVHVQQEIRHRLKPPQAEAQCETVQGNLSPGEERNRETIPTPRFARRPAPMNSLSVGQKDRIHKITWLIYELWIKEVETVDSVDDLKSSH